MRLLQHRGAAHRADVGQVRRLARTGPRGAMTTGAAAFVVHRFPARRVADLHRPTAHFESGADVGDKGVLLGGGDVELGHRGARDAAGDDVAQVLVRVDAPEGAAAEVDAAHPVAGQIVTGDALGAVETRAGFNVGRRIFPRMLLLGAETGTGDRACRHHGERQPERGRSSDESTESWGLALPKPYDLVERKKRDSRAESDLTGARSARSSGPESHWPSITGI